MSLNFERIRKSIGFKFALWYSVIFILSSLVLFVLLYFFLSLSLKNKEKELIQLELKECVTQYQKGGLDALVKEVEFEKHISGKNPFFVRLEGPQHNTLFVNLPYQWANFDLNQLKNKAVTKKDQWEHLITKDNKDIFEISSHFSPDGSLLQVGKSLSDSNEFLKHYRVIFASILIPMIVIGFIGGMFLAVHTLQPIRYLIDTTRSIIETNKMDVRIPATRRRDELEELSILFNTMLERIETLINGMRTGLDNLAHDLRTPITRLRGTAEIALHGEQNIDAIREALLDCLEESERVLVMLNTLMDISEAETGTMKLDWEEVDLVSLINEATDLYSYVAEEKKISVRTFLPKELYLTADPNRLRQVLSNLIDNAVKYTTSSGSIDIEAFQKDQQVGITIKDTGIGIPPEEVPRIWDRLYRGDKSRSQRGIGLGLSLVKAIVQAHRGQVEVSSTANRGSSFTVYIPQKP
jgi:signal transduction histidine kinase